MYKEQLYDRQIYKYPYFRIIKVTLKHRILVEGRITLVVSSDAKNLNIPVLGPEEPAISRIRNEYLRYHHKNSINISVINKKNYQKILNSFDAVAQYRAIKV
jgi:primosomal protein N' (replication factor Y)